MPRDKITTVISGRGEILNDLETLGTEFPAWTKEAFKAQEKVIEDAIRKNWLGIAGGRVGDYVYDSIGSSAVIGRNGTDVIGTVGVYNIDSVGRRHGRGVSSDDTKYKPLNAAQISYWVSFGTSRLRSGARKRKSQEYSEEDLITVAPRDFISPSFYSTVDAQETAFVNAWNDLMDRMLK